jgi:hypothetical protein
MKIYHQNCLRREATEHHGYYGEGGANERFQVERQHDEDAITPEEYERRRKQAQPNLSSRLGPEHRRTNTLLRPVIMNGVIYASASDAAAEIGFSASYIRKMAAGRCRRDGI